MNVAPRTSRIRNALAALPALAVLILPISSPAQTPAGSAAALEPGTVLRARGAGLDVSGQFIRWEPEAVVLTSGANVAPAAARGAPEASPRALAIAEIERLERAVPRSRGAGAGRGALWGAVAGGAFGALFGAAQETDCFLCPDSHAEGALWGAAFFGGLGGGVGALIGVIHPGTRWEPVELQSPAATASATGP